MRQLRLTVQVVILGCCLAISAFAGRQPETVVNQSDDWVLLPASPRELSSGLDDEEKENIFVKVERITPDGEVLPEKNHVVVTPYGIEESYSEFQSIQKEQGVDILVSDSRRFDPLVSLTDVGFDINPVFEANVSTIVDVIGLSYDVVNEFEKSGEAPSAGHPLYQSLEATGWSVTPFHGKSGETQDDVPGIVVFNRSSGVMIIGLHGSRSKADWTTNYDAAKVENEDFGLGIEGTLHRGFALKVSQFKSNLISVVAEILCSLSLEEQKSLLVFVTGHSQGAALAHITGVVIVQFFKEVFGEDYDNSIDNRVQLYRLSAPRTAGDSVSFKHMESIIGGQNDVRQNVAFDPVPSLGPGQTANRLLSWVNPSLADNYSGYLSSGQLAIQNPGQTVIKGLRQNLDLLFLNPLKSLKKLVLNGVGPLHLVSSARSKSGAGFAFDPSLVETDLREMLRGGLNKSLELNRASSLGESAAGLDSPSSLRRSTQLR